MIQKGMVAPDFALYDSDKNLVKLADYRNRKNVLLLFFPLAFTSTCTSELCEVRDNSAVFKDEHIEVMGISVDSVYSLAAYKEKYNLNYLMVSDFNKEVSRDYHVLYDSFSRLDMRGVSKRAAFLIDKEGIVQYSEVLDDANLVPDFTQIIQVLQFIR